MAEEPVNKQDVLEQINNTKRYITTHQDTLQEHLYNGMNAISKTLLAYRDSNGRTGWSAEAKDEQGVPIWSPKQQTILEETVPHFFETEQIVQSGGAFPKLSLKPSVDGQFVQTKLPISLSQISLDGAFYKVREFLAGLDAQNKELARILGPVAIINKMEKDPVIGPYPPYLPIRLQYPARAILPTINAILESIRLFVSISLTNSEYDNPVLRQILSVVLGIFDISRGEWRDGILSFLGLYSRNFLLGGFIAKTSRWVYNFMSPDIQERLEDDLWAGGKSIFIGFWLWTLSVVSPDFVRAQIQALLDSAKQPVEDLNKRIAEIEAQARSTGSASGAQISFPRVPLDKFPSFDDIQNFQSILHQPAVFCNPSFQQVLAPALMNPPLRIALELMNIPTLPEKIAEYCKGQPPDIATAITQELQPTVIPAPATAPTAPTAAAAPTAAVEAPAATAAAAVEAPTAAAVEPVASAASAPTQIPVEPALPHVPDQVQKGGYERKNKKKRKTRRRRSKRVSEPIHATAPGFAVLDHVRVPTLNHASEPIHATTPESAISNHVRGLIPNSALNSGSKSSLPRQSRRRVHG